MNQTWWQLNKWAMLWSLGHNINRAESRSYESWHWIKGCMTSKGEFPAWLLHSGYYFCPQTHYSSIIKCIFPQMAFLKSLFYRWLPGKACRGQLVLLSQVTHFFCHNFGIVVFPFRSSWKLLLSVSTFALSSDLTSSFGQVSNGL